MMSLCTALKAGLKDGMKVNGDSTVMSSMSKTYIQFKIYFVIFLSFFSIFFLLLRHLITLPLTINKMQNIKLKMSLLKLKLTRNYKVICCTLLRDFSIA